METQLVIKPIEDVRISSSINLGETPKRHHEKFVYDNWKKPFKILGKANIWRYNTHEKCIHGVSKQHIWDVKKSPAMMLGKTHMALRKART